MRANLVDTEFTTAYLGLGSNLGDRAGNLLLAVRALIEADFCVHKLSAIYETEPIDIESDLNFLNMVAELRVTNIRPSQMMARLLRIEYLLGRGDKTEKKPRTVDLDILFFGEICLESEFLTLPHPRLHLRKFVLVPFAEIAPTFIHPVLDLSITDILANVDDTSDVRRWDPNNPAAHELAAKS
ncbi:MAG: 2-amino-4-hydroxy-6-hydroxymethyldihydropteridine diphosphokinase [Pyrinomonadaceae bacterium]